MSTRLRVLSLGAAVAVLAGTNARTWAAAVPLTNADFETDLAVDPDGNNPVTATWGPPAGTFGIAKNDTYDPGVLGGAIFGGENNYLRTQAQGNVDGAGAPGPIGGVSFAGGAQVVNTTIQGKTRYTLSVDVAHDLRNPFPTNVPANDTYPAGFNGGNPIMLVRLFNTVGNVSLGDTAGVTLVSSSPIPAGGASNTWTRVYETSLAPANLGGAMFIQLFVQSNIAGGLQEALFDNVRLDVTTIPEPGSAVLLGLSGMALAWTRRRAQR